MADETPEGLFAEAQRLDAQAVTAGRETEAGRASRSQAAALRVKALGERAYPVLICSACYSVTGWTGAGGKCDVCLRAAELHAAFSDPHSGWVHVDDRRSPEAPHPKKPFRERLSVLGRRKSAANRAWLIRVDPGGTGPVSPEEGYELEAATRDEVATPDGSGMLVRFATCTHRFTGGDWAALGTTRIARGATHIPGEFSAGLAIEQLAEAWGDFRAAVDAFNRSAWAQESARRAAALAAGQEREDALRDQRNVADLLDES